MTVSLDAIACPVDHEAGGPSPVDKHQEGGRACGQSNVVVEGDYGQQNGGEQLECAYQGDPCVLGENATA